MAADRPLMVPSRRRLLRLIGGGAPLALAGCAASRADFIAPPAEAGQAVGAPLSGTRWRYQRINLYNDLPIEERICEVESVQPSLVVAWRDPSGRVVARERYASAWRVIEEPHFAEPIRYAEPVPVVPDPLRAGASLSVVTQYEIPGGIRAQRWRTDLRAPGWERVSVPAGTFDALRIERQSYFEPWQNVRFRARRVETLWYAPAVGRWVRRDWTGYYYDETTLGGSGPLARSRPEEREENLSWRLLAYEPAPVSGG